MKDLYKALGLTQAASASEIKKAYRILALNAHPDKGGTEEMMGLLNEAYQTLSDPDKRQTFDADWNVYLKTNVDVEVNCVINGHLPAGDTLPYSHTFREQHKALVVEYAKTPLKPFTQENFKSFTSNIYHLEVDGIRISDYHDIFSFIREKVYRDINGILSTPTVLITPAIAVNTFIDFLSGNYFGTELEKLKKYFTSEINKTKTIDSQASELLLYNGIFEIISITDQMPDKKRSLIFEIKKIIDFSKNAPGLILEGIIPLLYNKYFRNLYAYALTLYWEPGKYFFEDVNLDKFDGREEAKELLNELRGKFSGDTIDENLSNLIQHIRLLYNFDKDLHESDQLVMPLYKRREKALHLLDWMPALLDRSNKKILVNIFLQIGRELQKISRLEARQVSRMADERLALKIYLTAVVIGHNSTPDVEMYANTHALKYIAAFQYQDLMLTDVISGLKRRTFITTDVFPFFESTQSNVAILRQENKTIHLMRHLLNAMVKIYEYNKIHSDGIVIEHSGTTILYQAYEACLKNWYQEEFEPAVEKKLRLDLMDELLLDNDWIFLNVEQRIDSPWIMIDRDQQGWMRPTRSLPYAMEKEFLKYRTINGAEINHKTGEINFFMTPWTEDRPVYEKLFTIFDLQEMLEKKITGAIFSLDPVDPDKPFHPFNLMRFSPSQLCDSELLNTMLLTDYVLKFLTTNQEVQGQYPFDQRPIAPMIQHLPEYLLKIISRFHAEQHSGSLHRFWIEAEEIDILKSDEKITNDIARITLGSLKMVVKKHRMERDAHGELKDIGNEDEGWPIYVLTIEEMAELEMGIKIIDGHAMIFIYNKLQLFFWEHNKIIHIHHPKDFRETLIRLYKQPKDQAGKVVQNTKNMPLMFRVTKEMSHQSGLAHRYSPEFIFAHEFTTHYDEFAQYLPEFGRLKELSKISALIRFLSSMRQSNQEGIQALDSLLSTSPPSSLPDTEIYRAYNKNYQNVCKNVTSTFQNMRKDLASSVLKKKCNDDLYKIKNQIGELNYASYSPEVNESCQEWYDKIQKDNSGVSSKRIWDEFVNPKRSDIAKQLSQSKQSSIRKQLIEIFSSRLTKLLGAFSFGRLIDSFMQGNMDPLADALVSQEKTQACNEITKQFTGISTKDIALAIDDAGEVHATRIANEVARCQLTEQRELNNKLESGFVRINFGKHEEPIDLEGKCFWVPASTCHEVSKDATTGLSRYSFFVYGGVNLQPRINYATGGNGPLSGNAVGGGSFNRAETIRGFQNHHIISPTNSVTKNHELLNLAGFKNDIDSRPNRIYLPKNETSHPTRALHDGRHLQVEMDAVANRMDDVVARGRSENWTQTQYRSGLRDMLASERQHLRAGNVALNSKHRPWAKQ